MWVELCFPDEPTLLMVSPSSVSFILPFPSSFCSRALSSKNKPSPVIRETTPDRGASCVVCSGDSGCSVVRFPLCRFHSLVHLFHSSVPISFVSFFGLQFIFLTLLQLIQSVTFVAKNYMKSFWSMNWDGCPLGSWQSLSSSDPPHKNRNLRLQSMALSQHLCHHAKFYLILTHLAAFV